MAEQSLHAYAGNSPEPYTKYLYVHTRSRQHIVRKVVDLLAYKAAFASFYLTQHQIWLGDLYLNTFLRCYIYLVSKYKQPKDSSGGHCKCALCAADRKALSQSEGLANWDDFIRRGKKDCNHNCEPPQSVQVSALMQIKIQYCVPKLRCTLPHTHLLT